MEMKRIWIHAHYRLRWLTSRSNRWVDRLNDTGDTLTYFALLYCGWLLEEYKQVSWTSLVATTPAWRLAASSWQISTQFSSHCRVLHTIRRPSWLMSSKTVFMRIFVYPPCPQCQNSQRRHTPLTARHCSVPYRFWQCGNILATTNLWSWGKPKNANHISYFTTGCRIHELPLVRRLSCTSFSRSITITPQKGDPPSGHLIDHFIRVSKKGFRTNILQMEFQYLSKFSQCRLKGWLRNGAYIRKWLAIQHQCSNHQ